MPTYCHICTDCGYEWEDEYSIKEDPPKFCPECKKETAKRLISGGSGKGIVQLTGFELKAKIKEDARKITRDSAKKEKLLSNLVGNDRYQEIQTREDKKRR